MQSPNPPNPPNSPTWAKANLACAPGPVQSGKGPCRADGRSGVRSPDGQMRDPRFWIASALAAASQLALLAGAAMAAMAAIQRGSAMGRGAPDKGVISPALTPEGVCMMYGLYVQYGLYNVHCTYSPYIQTNCI